MTAAIKELSTLNAKLEKLWRRRPDQVHAVDVLVSAALAEDRNTARAIGADSRRLLSRLQAVHDCPQGDGGFEQLTPSASGVRQWRCQGCGVVVTLEGQT